tara:strand:- start:122 stop:1333 length:1212 start_codon:yes stop_codon:yes gene_type:complete
MKIGIFLEGTPQMGGGFFQSLKSLLLLLEIEKYKSLMEVIITNNEAVKYLKEKKIKTKLFRLNIFTRYFSQLFEIDLIKDLLNKLKIKYPFTKFIRENKYDLIIFLGPSILSKFCAEISFVSNIWDINHKKNSQFPEHNFNFNFENKEKLYSHIVHKAFKILVAHQSNKEDLINFYKANESRVLIQNFIPMLPTLHEKNIEKKFDYKELFEKFDLPRNKKIIFYPAQFWAHKNHKYLIDAANILKLKKNDNFFFVFCGGNKGNFDYIKNLIKHDKLDSYVKILNFINDNEVISLYLNSEAIVMPTYCGPTNLPIYEAFYFKKIIFYTKGLIEDNILNDHLINIDTSNPEDLCEKLQICFEEDKKENIVKKNYEFYKNICCEKTFKKNYTQILDEFSYLIKRWK